MSKKIYDTIIIGLGPAGMTAAIYAKRMGLDIAVIGREIGGQLSEAPLVENFPSSQPVPGEVLTSKMFDQILSMDIENYVGYSVIQVSFEENIYHIETDLDKDFYSKTLIVATGAEHIKIPFDGDEDVKDNIHYCVLCDGPFYKGKNVIVVGSGNSGAQDALELNKYCNSVMIIEKADHICCEDVLRKRLEEENITCLLNTTIISCLSDNNKLIGVCLSDNRTYFANGIFVAVGQRPDLSFLGDLIMTDFVEIENGYGVVNPYTLESTCSGLFIAGDCRVTTVRQGITAAGDGALAAVSANKYLEKMKGFENGKQKD